MAITSVVFVLNDFFHICGVFHLVMFGVCTSVCTPPSTTPSSLL